jgi:hypothetical protein
VVFLNNREKIIKEQIQAEKQLETVQIGDIKQKVWEFLINEKQFKIEEIETDPEFKITLGDCKITVH